MNKILLITGASSDIGMSLVEKIADRYDWILAHYNHWTERLEQIKKSMGEKIVFIQADFADEESVLGMIAWIKEKGMEPDHIVHLPAPRAINQKFVKTEWKAFEAAWNISLRSAVLLFQAFIPKMQKQRYGKVIVMLSAYTMNLPPKYQTVYITSKYALLGLMNSLAVEYHDKGITVNGVSPDMIQTKFITELPDILVKQYSENRPQKRILDVEEVVPTFEFLLSDAADQITGMNICIGV